MAFTEAIKSPAPSSTIRLTQGQVWASKHTDAGWTAILIQTSDGCRLHLVGPADAFICVHFFSSHGCLKLTYSIPHSARLQHNFQLRLSWILSALTTWSQLHHLAGSDASWFQHEWLGASVLFNGKLDWAGLVAHNCLYIYWSVLHLLYVHNASILYCSIHSFMCLSGHTFTLFIHMCLWPSYVHLQLAFLGWTFNDLFMLFWQIPRFEFKTKHGLYW